MYRNYVFVVIAVVCLSSLWACKKEDKCLPESFALKEYGCFEATTLQYVLQNAEDLANFIDVTACKVCDCMPPNIEIDFATQTALAVYTQNCGNNLEVCRNDAAKEVIYTLTQAPIDCIIAIPDYNLITVSKIPSNYTVAFVFE